MQPGTRVEVFSGDGSGFLGYGKFVGHATVYFVATPTELVSMPNAEEKPSDEFIAKHKGRLVTVSDNPKIILDDGRVVYGCQVWWNVADES